MKIDRVELDNFGAFYGAHTFKVCDRGLTMILGDNRDEPRMNSNGAAKSTLFDAIDWCLFGVVPKGDHVDSIVNDESKSARVIVVLTDDDGTEIRVQRHRKWPDEPRGLRYWTGAEEQTTLDDKETQALLERVLGLDRDVFHAAIYFSQGDGFNFADATDGERLEILTKMYRLEHFDEWLEQVKTQRNGLAAILASTQTRVASLEGEITGLEATDFTAQIHAFEQQRGERVAQLSAKLIEIDGYLAQAQASLAGEAQAQAYLQSLEFQRPTVPLISVPAEIQNYATQCSGLAHSARAAYQLIERRLVKIQNTGVGECQECGQPVTAGHIEHEKAKIAKEREQAAAEMARADTAFSQASARVASEQVSVQKRMNDAATAAKIHADTVAEARAGYSKYAELRRYLDTTRATRTAMVNELETVRAQANPAHAQAEALRSRANQARAALALEQENLKSHAYHLDHLDFWVTGFGAKGLKSYILDSKLQEMTDAANEWIKILTGGTIWVRFETQTMGRSTGKLSNKTNIRVFRYNRNGTVTERNYRSWSGGEKKRVAWGISFGFSRLVAARARKRYDTLILDEVFKYVDRAGKDAVVEMLKYIKREKSSVFVIEHDADFQGAFEQRVLVRKENGRSTIIEAVNEQATEEARQDESPVQSAEGRQGTTRPRRTPVSDGVPASPPVPGRRGPARKPAQGRAAASPRR